MYTRRCSFGANFRSDKMLLIVIPNDRLTMIGKSSLLCKSRITMISCLSEVPVDNKDGELVDEIIETPIYLNGRRCDSK